MKKIILIILVIYIGRSEAQLPTLEWVARYHNTHSFSHSLSMDKLGNIFISGVYKPINEDSKFLTLKYNSTGRFLWAAFYQGPDTLTSGDLDIAYINIADGAGNVYVGGTSVNNMDGKDIFIIKYNSDGDSIWTARYNGPGNSEEYFASMVMDRYANIYVTGSSFGDYVTLKYDSSGNKLWEARYNNVFNSTDISSAIAIDSSLNVYVTGYCLNANVRNEYVTVKYSKTGVQQWVAKYWALLADAEAVSVAVDRQENVYVTGQVDSTQPYYAKYVTVKYDSSGTQLWARDFKGNILNADTPYEILLDTSGSPIVSGTSIVKYNSSGVFLWADTISYGRFAAVDNGNNFYKTGGRSDTTLYRWLETTKYNENGDKLWTLVYGRRLGGEFVGSSDIFVDENSNIYISADIFDGPPGIDSILLLKYSQLIGISGNNNGVPGKFQLYQNYPNPFNPKTKIKFDVPASNLTLTPSTRGKGLFVKLIVYDITGREIAVLINEQLSAGNYEAVWDASNFASGIYFYSLRTGSIIITKKMVLVR